MGGHRLGLGLALEFDVVDRGEKLMDEFWLGLDLSKGEESKMRFELGLSERGEAMERTEEEMMVGKEEERESSKKQEKKRDPTR